MAQILVEGEKAKSRERHIHSTEASYQSPLTNNKQQNINVKNPVSPLPCKKTYTHSHSRTHNDQIHSAGKQARANSTLFVLFMVVNG